MNKEEKNKSLQIRSSAAEYLSFVAATGDNSESVEMRYEDENIWLTQKMMATLYDVSVAAISQHLKNIFDDDELTREPTIKKYLIVQNEGDREVARNIEHYNLQAIIAVGFKVNNERAVQFRKWANTIVKNYTIQGWAMDVERLKNSGSILTKEYFEKQLEQIREIRLSERKFYQKITDIYTTAIDYDATAKSTKRFFSAVQNKMHWAIHGHTAAEVIIKRANHQKENMGLTTWESAPHGKIHKYDVSVAKNYLSDFEMGQLERMVSAYLDIAELQARRNIPMTMNDWETRLNRFLEMMDHGILQDAGKVTAELAKTFAESETFCGDCGTRYRRTTWSKRGKKKIIWRCIERLTGGAKKTCKHSPSIEESILHDAIMQALAEIEHNKDYLIGILKLGLTKMFTGTSSIAEEDNIKNRIAELNKIILDLISANSKSNEGADYLDERCKELSDEISQLEAQLDELKISKRAVELGNEKLNRMINYLDSAKLNDKFFDEEFTRKVVDKVTIISKDEIEVIPKYGLPIRVRLSTAA